MDIFDKVQQIKDSDINGQPRQAFAQLKEVNNDEDYSMVEVLTMIAVSDQQLATRLSNKLIEEAY